MSNFRIVKNTLGDGSENFTIQKQSVWDKERWNDITVRETIEEARYAITVARSKEVVSKEVVE